MDGDSTYHTLDAMWNINHQTKDSMTVWLLAQWDWYETGNGLCDYGYIGEMSQELKMAFDFEPITGVITPRTGSGLDGVPNVNIASTAIDFSYAINNDGQSMHTAIVTFKAIGGIRATYSVEHSGGIDVDGKVIGGLSGSFKTGVVETMDEIDTSFRKEEIVTFKLLATEDPNP